MKDKPKYKHSEVATAIMCKEITIAIKIVQHTQVQCAAFAQRLDGVGPS